MHALMVRTLDKYRPNVACNVIAVLTKGLGFELKASKHLSTLRLCQIYPSLIPNSDSVSYSTHTLSKQTESESKRQFNPEP